MSTDMRPETVIVVHGTFDAPLGNALKWYQPNGAFCRALDRALEQLGSSARCWAHLADSEEEIFYWDGGNSYQSRYDACAAFNAYYGKLHAAGWKCHVVAHSHGGNVILRGLYQEIETHLKGWGAGYVDMTMEEARETGHTDYWSRNRGEIVCLGTPFLDAPQFQHIWIGPTRSVERRSAITTIAGASLCLAAYVLVALAYHVATRPLVWVGFVFLAAWCLFQAYQAFLLFAGTYLLDVHYHEREAPEPENGHTFFMTHCLCLTSPHDEPGVLLRGFQEQCLRIFESKAAEASRTQGKQPFLRRLAGLGFEVALVSVAALL